VAKGKQDWDKCETERRREADREARAAIKANKHRSSRNSAALTGYHRVQKLLRHVRTIALMQTWR
jgi:hypothetical protein